MLIRAFVVAAVLIPASASFAAVGDNCTPDVVAADGTVTTENFADRCDGALAVFCAAPADSAAGAQAVERTADCATFGGNTGGSCKISDLGNSTCTIADGQGCILTNRATNESFRVGCTNETSGCIDGICVADQSCVDPAEEEAATCDGDLVDLGCADDDTKVQFSCQLFAAINGAEGLNASTCTTSGDSFVCVGAIAGQACAANFITCDTGLFCNGETAETFGSCGTTDETPAEGEGEGEGEGGGREGEGEGEEPAPSGCTSNGNGSTVAFGVLGLAVLALRRRRA